MVQFIYPKMQHCIYIFKVNLTTLSLISYMIYTVKFIFEMISFSKTLLILILRLPKRLIIPRPLHPLNEYNMEIGTSLDTSRTYFAEDLMITFIM